MLPSTGMHQSIAELRDTNSYSQNPKGTAQYPQSRADLAPAWDLMLDESKSYRGPKFFRGTTSAASSSSLSSAQLLCWWVFFWLFVLIKHQCSGFPEYKGHGRMGCAGIWDWIWYRLPKDAEVWWVPKYLEELGRGVRGNQSRTPQALNNIQTSLK